MVWRELFHQYLTTVSRGAGTSLQTCTHIYASLTHAQCENAEQTHVRDVLILVQVWRLVPASALELNPDETTPQFVGSENTTFYPKTTEKAGFY